MGRHVTLVVPGLLAVPMAFTTVITPPAAPRDPVTVIIVDLGHTPSLVLPTHNGAMVRCAYGDWRWYALAAWLKELGCTVRGPAFASRWRVTFPEE